MPLSSKSHWDVPVRLGDGSVVHALCSHPTPPCLMVPRTATGSGTTAKSGFGMIISVARRTSGMTRV